MTEHTSTDAIVTKAHTELSGTNRGNVQLATDMRERQAEAFRVANADERTLYPVFETELRAQLTPLERECARDAVRCADDLRGQPHLQPWTQEREDAVLVMAYRLMLAVRGMKEAIVHGEHGRGGQ